MRIQIATIVVACAALAGCVTTPSKVPSYVCTPEKFCTCGQISWGLDGKVRIPTERPKKDSAGSWYCESGAIIYNRDSYSND